MLSSRENPCPEFSDKVHLLEDITLCLTISFQLGHLFSINYHHPSNICGLSEIQRYFLLSLDLSVPLCLPVINSCPCDWRSRYDERKAAQSTSPIAEHFDLPSSHMLELQSGFRLLRGLPGCSFGYKSKGGL